MLQTQRRGHPAAWRVIFTQAGDRATVALVDGPTNNLTNLAVQEVVLTRTQEWLESCLRTP